MRRIFRGFCIKRFGIGPLHYISSRSDFCFEFAEIFIFENRLPAITDTGSRRLSVSVIRVIADSSYRWVGESTTPHIGESGSRYLIKISTRKKNIFRPLCVPVIAGIPCPSCCWCLCCFMRSVVGIPFLICQCCCCCQHHCLAGTVVGVSTVAYVTAVTDVLLLVVSQKFLV